MEQSVFQRKQKETKSRLNYKLSHLSMKGWTRLWKHDKPYEFFVFITYLASIQFVRAPEANQVYLSWSPTNSTGTGRSSSLNPCLSTRGENVCNRKPSSSVSSKSSSSLLSLSSATCSALCDWLYRINLKKLYENHNLQLIISPWKLHNINVYIIKILWSPNFSNTLSNSVN